MLMIDVAMVALGLWGWRLWDLAVEYRLNANGHALSARQIRMARESLLDRFRAESLPQADRRHAEQLAEAAEVKEAEAAAFDRAARYPWWYRPPND
jgi:hypothetical protein